MRQVGANVSSDSFDAENMGESSRTRRKESNRSWSSQCTGRHVLVEGRRKVRGRRRDSPVWCGRIGSARDGRCPPA
eukprot:1828569-Pleurochrysis_carterae.AAC.1